MRNTKFFNLRSRALPLLAAVCTLSVAAAAHAQFRSSLTGTVTDTTGAVIPNAKLILKDTATGKVLNATSNGEGFYSFNALPPDQFELVTSLGGFQTKTIRNLTIIPEQPNSVNVQLEAGAITTTVDVNADSIPSLETSTASLNNTISSNEIQHLPSAGRDIFQLAQLAPGAFGDGQRSGGGGTSSLPGTQGPGGTGNTSGVFATENGPQTLGNGGQYETNSISIDGISTTSAVWGGTTIITPNEDSVDSVKITPNGYDAEFGRFSGTNLQVTTKSGTNNFHGSFFFRVARPGLNAFQRYNGPGSLVNTPPPATGPNTNVTRAAARGLLRDTARYNDFGGSIGGPLWKNKAFFFFAIERIANNSQVTANGWYETPQFDAAAPAGYISNTYLNFPNHGIVGATQTTSTCAAAGLVENVNCRTVAGGIDVGSPLRTARGTQDPTTNTSATPAVYGLGSGFDNVPDLIQYNTSTPSTVTQTQYNGRLDADASHRDHLSFAIYWVPVTQHFINGPARGYNQWNHNQINDAFTVIWNHTFSPTFLNEARANAAGWRWNELTDNPQEPFGLAADSINAIGNFTPQFFGANGPSHLNQWTFGYKDVATKVINTHTIKFGAEATQLHYLQDPLGAARPNFNFYNIWNFLNDAPFQEGGQFNRFTGTPFSNRFDQREWIFGGFAQDDWKVTKNLTVNVGLRYNYFAALYAKQGNLPHIQFGSGAAALTGINNVRGGDAWTPDKGNFGPQFGFAYNPDFLKHFVMRGGYGINYNQEEIAISANVSNNPNDAVNATFNQSTPLAADPRIRYSTATDTSSIFGYPSNANAVVSYGANGLPTTSGFGVTALPNHLHTQMVHHYSLDTQYDLGYNMVASVGYEGSSAKHLIFHQNLNLYEQFRGIAPNPAINFLEYFGDGGGSNYNALLVDLKHTMSHQFMVDASFTYSKSMDDNSGPYEIDYYTYQPAYNRAPSDFNVSKALKVYGLYTPKFYYGSNKLAQVFLNGFNISGIWNAHTGFPWTPVANYSTNAYYVGSNIGSLRPRTYNGRAGRNYGNSAFEQAAGPSSNFSGGAGQYFTAYTQGQLNSVAFPNAINTYPVPGIGRNSFIGPRYSAVDATVTKSFGVPNRYLGERTGIEFRVDAFNVFNQNNASPAIDNDITHTTFGLSTSGLAGRQMQMQARLSF